MKTCINVSFRAVRETGMGSWFTVAHQFGSGIHTYIPMHAWSSIHCTWRSMLPGPCCGPGYTTTQSIKPHVAFRQRSTREGSASGREGTTNMGEQCTHTVTFVSPCKGIRSRLVLKNFPTVLCTRHIESSNTYMKY